MDEVDLLLSDEFVAFSEIIASIHAEKKKKKKELKDIYDKMKKEIDDLDERAKAAHAEYDKWIQTQNEEA